MEQGINLPPLGRHVLAIEPTCIRLLFEQLHFTNLLVVCDAYYWIAFPPTPGWQNLRGLHELFSLFIVLTVSVTLE